MNTRRLWLAYPLFLVFGFFGGYLQPAAKEQDAADLQSSAFQATEVNQPPSAVRDGRMDIREAFLSVASYPSTLHREYALAELLAQLKPDDIPVAIAAALTLPNEDRADLLRSLYMQWIKYDPEAACQHALQYANEVEATLQAWMTTDPAAVLAWVRKLSANERRSMNWFGLKAALAVSKEDPDSVATLFLELCSKQSLPADQLSEFFKTWSSHNPQKAAAEALAIRNGGLRGKAILTVAESWAERDPGSALAWLANVQDEQTRQQAELRVLGTWAAKDFKAATAYAQQIPDEKARNLALVKVATGMLRVNPETARTFADNLPLSLLEAEGFYRKWSDTAPEAATAAYLQRMLELDPEARRSHFDELGQVFHKWSAAEPRLSAEFGLNQPEGLRDVLIQEAIENWVDTDRPAAIQWGMDLPEGPARGAALRSVATRWAIFSTNEVAAWLQSLPPGPSRDAAVTGFAKTAIRSDVEGAISWVRSIPDPQRSADALVEAWRAWTFDTGFLAAMRWLEEAKDLTPLERASLERAERAMRVE